MANDLPDPDLSKEDWSYIHHTMQVAFNKARPRPSEGKPSKEFLDQEKRILTYLQRKWLS